MIRALGCRPTLKALLVVAFALTGHAQAQSPFAYTNKAGTGPAVAYVDPMKLSEAEGNGTTKIDTNRGAATNLAVTNLIRSRAYNSVVAGELTAYSDMIGHYWSPSNSIPSITPLAGGYTIAYGSGGTPTTFWQMCEMSNVLYWQWKLTGSEDARNKLRSNYNWIRSQYTVAELSSADDRATVGGNANPAYNDLIINAEDDAALAITFFTQVNDATGDQNALAIAHDLIISTYTFFADPNNGGAGLLYVAAGNTNPYPSGTPQQRSQIIEALTARQALYVYEHTGETAFLNYATTTWAWIRQYLNGSVDNAAIANTYFCELDLVPSDAGYKKPYLGSGISSYTASGGVGSYTDRGSSLSYFGGNMAFASLSAELYMLTGSAQYLSAVTAWISASQQTNTFVRATVPSGVLLASGNVFVDDRDGWSDGYFAPLFVHDVLTMAGIDASGTWRALLQNTASSIIQQRTSSGFYTADWSGPELEVSGIYSSWQAQSQNGGSSATPANEAAAVQEMTSVSSVALIQAAAMTLQGGIQ